MLSKYRNQAGDETKRRSTFLRFSLFMGGIVIIYSIFELWLLNVFTEFLVGPIFFSLVAIIFILTIASIFYALFRVREERVAAFFPLLTYLTVIFISQAVPFWDIWLNAKFAIYQRHYHQTAVFLEQNQSQTLDGYQLLLLADSDQFLSVGGDILFYKVGQRTEIIFFTRRAILARGYGFLYLSDDDSSQALHITGWEIEKPIKANWYFAVAPD